MEPDLTGPLFRMRRIAKGGPDYVGRVRPCGVLLKKRGCLSFPLALFLWQPLAFSKGAANVDGPNPKKPNELRRRDLNPRPPGYEPGELPTAPRHDVGTNHLWNYLGARTYCLSSNTKFVCAARVLPVLVMPCYLDSMNFRGEGRRKL